MRNSIGKTRGRTVAARSGRTLLFVLVPLVVLLAVAAIYLWPRPSARPNLEEGQKCAEQFLALIREGHPDRAWQSTTAEFKSAQGRDRFLRYLKDKAFLRRPLAFVSVQTVTVQNSPRAEYIYRVAGTGQTVRLLTAKEGASWRVDRMLVE
jgi:hypothetical protein